MMIKKPPPMKLASVKSNVPEWFYSQAFCTTLKGFIMVWITLMCYH